MPDTIDIFELSIELIWMRLQKKIPEKYKTLELNMMVGAVMRTCFNLIMIFTVENKSLINFTFYTFMLFTQALFMNYETYFIFDGRSDTECREIWFKLMSFAQGSLQFCLLYILFGNEDLLLLFNEQQFTFSSVYQGILLFLIFLDFWEFLIVYIRSKCCAKYQLDYYSPGQTQYFLKFRLAGNVFGLFIWIIYIFRSKQSINSLLFLFAIIQIGVEVMIMLTYLYFFRFQYGLEIIFTELYFQKLNLFLIYFDRINYLIFQNDNCFEKEKNKSLQYLIKRQQKINNKRKNGIASLQDSLMDYLKCGSRYGL